jgi:hypothetical protein
LNYKIIIMLNSEAKSEIEGIRGVLIRRAILGIIFMAILTLGTLQYASYLSHLKAKQKALAEKEVEAAADSEEDRSSSESAAGLLAAS